MQDKREYSIEELLNIAQQCEMAEEFDVALKYYRVALERDNKLSAAKMGVERAKNQLAKAIFFRSPANFKLTTGRLELRRGMIVFVSDSSSETEYELEYIENPKIQLGRLKFDYKGQTIEGYSCNVAKKWVALINEVKAGVYPVNAEGSLSTVEKYIKEHFTMANLEDAVEYFEGITGCDYSDARIVVVRVLSSR